MKLATTIVDYQVLLNFMTSGFFAESLVILCYGIEDTTREVYYEPLRNEEEEKEISEDEAEEFETIPDEITISSDELKCKVCLLHFSDKNKKRSPRMLSKCGHTLCKSCCQNIYRQTDNLYILCPFCRITTYASLKALPKNYIAIGMLQAIERLNRRER
ncbi:hypothetical protein CAEBREN_23125 [Caenorhabditis brenneri]|uniref:RING-type domain-containing protein n=1 Tax=Caenorhabditis brenneri TaxID=135651 RepID=G0NJ39_CAEBE|nr:hypothetical protein CAEBREN_23125 [Caenorhabditis brenneri]